MAHRLPKHGSKLICMIYHTQNNNFELIIVTILLSAKIYDFLKTSIMFLYTIDLKYINSLSYG